MAKPKRRRTLGVLLLIYAVASFLAGALAMFGADALGTYVVEKHVYAPARILEKEKAIFREFIDWMNANAITDFADTEAIQPWFAGRRHLMISVYNAGYLFDGSESTALIYADTKDAAATYELLQSEFTDYWYTCPVTVRGDFMRTKVVRVMYFPMYDAERIVRYASIALGCVCFGLCLLLMVRRITRYIALLTKELNVMAGGELNRPMTVKGADELTTLAENMDEMRLSFIERLRREEELQLASKSLLTDMSHDLRTPLAALIGYLDILTSGKVTDESERAKYLTSARKRAWQIKDMTDDMFEYSLVYASGEARPETQELDAVTLAAQLWDETSFALESEGFACESRVEGASAPIEVNVGLIKRVFDNIASNIRKYALKTERVSAVYGVTDGVFRLTVTNTVSQTPAQGESSGIGLKSCEKIAQLHGGAFECGENGRLFRCTLTLPAKKSEAD